MNTVGTFTPEPEAWDPNSVGRQIRVLREERSMTAGALATECQVTPAYIYQIESGLLAPSLRIIGRISEVLQIHPRDLFV